MQSSGPGKQMALQTLKKESNSEVTNVATGASVPLHRESIMRGNEWSLPLQDPFDIDHLLVSHESDLGRLFFNLPRELRDEIYSHLITSGHPQFMGASQVMYAEGRALIFKEGTYRVNFRINHRTNFFKEANALYNCTQPTSKIADNIQNLNIQIRWSHGNQDWNLLQVTEGFSWIESFKDSPFARRRCTIAVEVYPRFHTKLLSTVAGSMKELKSFDTVAFCIRDDPDYRGFIKAYFSAGRIMVARGRAYAEMEAHLKPHLGNGEMSFDGDEPILLFRPRKALQATECRVRDVSVDADGYEN